MSISNNLKVFYVERLDGDIIIYKAACCYWLFCGAESASDMTRHFHSRKEKLTRLNIPDLSFHFVLLLELVFVMLL